MVFLFGRNGGQENVDEFINQVRAGRKNLIALYAFVATSRFWVDGGIWLVFWQQRGLSLFEVGLLESLLHVVCLVSDVPIGIFADRFGWKLSLLVSAVFGIGYTSLALFSHSFWLAAASFVLRGLQVTFVNGSDTSIAYESAGWAGVQNRYLAISGRLVAISLISMGIAEATGGALAAWSWSAVYVLYTIVNVISFFTVLWVREPREMRKSVREHASVFSIAHQAVQFAKKSPPFLAWIALSGILFGCIATFAFYGQSLLLHAGYTLVGIGILTGFENGLGALLSSLAEGLVKRMGNKRMVTVSSILAAIGLMLFAWLPGLSLGFGYLLGSIAGNAIEPLIEQGLNQIIPSEQRATLLSFNSTAFSVFMIFGFPLFGWLAQSIGLFHAAQLGSVIGVIAILGVTYWWRGRERVN